jgi:hypothetical protein
MRRPVISIEVLNTSVLLSASSTTGHAQRESSDTNNNKGVLLAGFLIILKLSIQSLVINLHKKKIVTFQPPIELSGTERETRGGGAALQDVIVPILSSSNDEHFLTACVLLDIPPGAGTDDNGDQQQPAVDIQVSLSALDIVMKKDVIAVMVEPKVRAYTAQTLYCFRKILIHLGVLLDESLVVEHSVECYGVPSVMLRNLRARMVPSGSGSSLTSGGVDTGMAFALDEDEQMDQHIKAVTSYLNTSRYYKLLSAMLPKGVLSLVVNLSAIQADLLSSSSIKTFLILVMHDLFDRALSDPNSTNASAVMKNNALNAYLKQATKRTVRKSTKIGQRMSNSMRAGGSVKTSATASTQPISIEVKKATDPIPLITLNCLGFNCSVPVDDDTICRGLAILLGSMLPFYSIRTVPPPKVSDDDDDEGGADGGNIETLSAPADLTASDVIIAQPGEKKDNSAQMPPQHLPPSGAGPAPLHFLT